MSRKIIFTVPTDVLAEFAGEIVDRGLQAVIAGANEDGDILLEIEFEKEETSEVDKLEDYLEKIKEEAGHETE